MPDFRLPPLNVGERVYRACLHCYPARFRREFAQDLIETFRDERRQAIGGGMPAAAFWMESLQDVITQGLAERVAASARALSSRQLAEDSLMFAFPKALSLGEIRIAARRLRRAPGFVAATTLVLALAIGATTAVFSVLNGVLLRPLSYPAPEQLIAITHTAQVDGVTSVDQSAGGLIFYQEHARTLQASGGWRDRDVNVSPPVGDPGPAERISGAMVTANLFDVLGVPASIGRTFRPGEDRPGAAPVVLLSNRLWRRYFRSDPSAIGRVIEVDGISRRIVGVMPRGFTFIKSAPELWFPMTLDPATANVADFNYRSVARLRPGETMASARADLARILPSIVDEFPTGVPRAMWERAHVEPVITPLRDYIVGDVSSVLWILFGSMALVLVIACANVASLLLVRAEGQRHELAVRGALGAGLTGMMATSLCESLLLAVIGGAFGIACAELAVRAMILAGGGLAIPRIAQVAVDGRVLAFAMATTALCAIVVGILPMLRARRVPVGIVLREASRGGTASMARQRARSALVIAQIAFGLVLVASSALLARSFLRLRDVQPGFRSDGVITARLVLPSATYATRAAVALAEQRILDAVRAIPGVRAASLTDWVPLTDDQNTAIITVEDHPLPPGTVPGVHSTMTVDRDYFSAMGIPMLAGRTLDAIDPTHPSHDVVVSRSFANRFWPSESALGKRIHPGISGPWFTIVGVAGDAHYDGLDKPVNEAVYLPIVVDSAAQTGIPRHVALVVAAGAHAVTVAPALRRVVRGVDPSVPTFDERTLSNIVSRATAGARVTLALLLSASVLALVLGAVGVYGVMSYAVSLRQREIGVRIALGAEPREVRWMISRQGLRLALAGVGIGLALAITITRVLRGLLFGTSPTDPITLAFTCVVLLATGVAASWLPARRAAAIDPAEALRSA